MDQSISYLCVFSFVNTINIKITALSSLYSLAKSAHFSSAYFLVNELNIFGNIFISDSYLLWTVYIVTAAV